MTSIHDEVHRARQAMIDEIEELRALTKKQREALELCREYFETSTLEPGFYKRLKKKARKAVEECLTVKKPQVDNIYKNILHGEIKSGTYKGVWSGYVIMFSDGDSDYRLHVDIGVRGTTTCMVDITAEGISIRQNENPPQ